MALARVRGSPLRLSPFFSPTNSGFRCFHNSSCSSRRISVLAHCGHCGKARKGSGSVGSSNRHCDASSGAIPSMRSVGRSGALGGGRGCFRCGIEVAPRSAIINRGFVTSGHASSMELTSNAARSIA